MLLLFLRLNSRYAASRLSGQGATLPCAVRWYWSRCGITITTNATICLDRPGRTTGPKPLSDRPGATDSRTLLGDLWPFKPLAKPKPSPPSERTRRAHPDLTGRVLYYAPRKRFLALVDRRPSYDSGMFRALEDGGSSNGQGLPGWGV